MEQFDWANEPVRWKFAAWCVGCALKAFCYACIAYALHRYPHVLLSVLQI